MHSKKRIVAAVLAAAMLAVPMTGCQKDDADTIKIGGLAPLTGSVAQYGTAVDNGVKLAIKEINANGGVLGKQIDYIVKDESGDAQQAVQAYRDLVDNEGIVALIGDVTSGPTEAVAQKAAADNIPMITASGTSEKITTFGKNVFRTCFIDPYQGKLMASYAAEKIATTNKNVAVLYDIGDPYSVGIAEAFKAEAATKGLTVVAYESYTSGSKDFNAQLTKIKAADPAAIMLPVYYEDAAQIARQAKNLGITAALLGADGWDGVVEQFPDASELDAVANTFFCSQYSASSTDPKLQNFLKTYKETYGKDANMFAVLAYDTAYILAKAIEKAGSTDSDAIIQAMTETNHSGLTGNTTFDENRNPVREALITTIADGGYKFVENYSAK